VLRDAIFLPQTQWLAWGESEQWSKNLVAYKTYDLNRDAGQTLRTLLYSSPVSDVPDFAPNFVPVIGDERLVTMSEGVKREGQGAFRLRLLDAYKNQCAVTNEHAVPVLDAAHIQPYLGPASNHIQNGILLRTDLHRLYDKGYITITPDLKVEVSSRLKEEFNNGKVYYAFHGRNVIVPPRDQLRPSKDALIWHAENVFR
jgi:putative restriction endonuclease